MTTVFFSYSHKDEDLRDRLETHLSVLKRQRLIDAWHDRRIKAGDEVDHSIDSDLNAADVILLLVSPDFLASSYCYDVEMQRAMERHEAREASVIPVILKHCDWHSAPFGKLLAAPKDGKPIKAWADADEAFLDVVKQIRAELPAKPVANARAPKASPAPVSTAASAAKPRSSNLRLKKTFTEAERDRFLHASFDFMAEFFEASLAELEERNDGIETSYRSIDADRFTATVYKNGKAIARCTSFGGAFGRGISFSHNDQASDGSMNESLSVKATDSELYLKALGMASYSSVEDRKLSQAAAAEYYWSLFIEPLQR
ncbi:TIR domain-containing protein [Bradyrhizobium yuanmingense]|uniref:toll/interleukin-1 receptor domain-containing protein n=1 Tax=Bradyrhizobium yuanmingense TaxID=108015 RepID=UPI0013608471|nr:TIR domain-containing protein [Bradyrhizobium yuanmingense]